jgi:hypothetical protein
MLATLLAKENIVHVGALLYFAGFLFSDQLVLRAFVIAGDLVYIVYFLAAPAEPLWGGIFWSAIFIAVNVWMIGRLVADRADFRMSEEERRLFQLLETLSPGEFRRLIKLGRWHSAEKTTVLTVEDKPLDRLYYVLSGDIDIDKVGQVRTIGPETFIGEVAFLTSRPASATVTITAGARYVVWEMGPLRRLLFRTPSLHIAVSSALNRHMAVKIARA